MADLGVLMSSELTEDPPVSPCAASTSSAARSKKRTHSDDRLISPARLSGRSTPQANEDAQEAALMAERHQAQVALLTPFQRLTVELPSQDQKRLRLSVASDDPLDVDELGEMPPENLDASDESCAYVHDADMVPCRRSPTDHERLSPISRMLLAGTSKPGKAVGLWTLQRRSTVGMSSSLTSGEGDSAGPSGAPPPRVVESVARRHALPADLRAAAAAAYGE